MKKIFILILTISLFFQVFSYSENKKYQDFLKNLKMKENLIINFKIENFSNGVIDNFWKGKYEISPEVVRFTEENKFVKREFYIVEEELYEKVENEWIKKANNIEIFQLLKLDQIMSEYLQGYNRFVSNNLLEFYPSPEYLEFLFDKIFAKVKDILDKNPTGKLWINEKLSTIEKIEVALKYADFEKKEFFLKSSMEIEEVKDLNISLPPELENKVYSYINLKSENCSIPEKDLISVLEKRKEKLNIKGKIFEKDGKIVVRIPKKEGRESLKYVFSAPGNLEFRLVWNDEKRLKKAISGEIPPGFEILYKENLNPVSGEIYKEPYLVKKKNEISQNLIEKVEKEINKYNNMLQVVLRFNKEGREKIEKFTKENLGKFLTIVMDKKILSLSRIVEPVYSGTIIIQNNLSEKDADELVAILEGGEVSCNLKIINE
jgi:hypothetical protein